MHVRGRRAWALTRIATRCAGAFAGAFGLVTAAWRVLLSCFAPRRGPHRIALPAAELQRVTSKALLAGGDRAEAELTELNSPIDPADVLPYGDFSGPAEAERFAALPPIGPEATDDVDWDALARDLTRRA